MINGFESWRQCRSITVIGAAFGDILLDVTGLPKSGEDVVANEKARQIGGCAFNVARVLARLDVSFVNGIPVGSGVWGEAVANAMRSEGFEPQLFDQNHDNGWCLALVEPNKERTFITVEGCEQHWNEAQLRELGDQHNRIVYVSGYELVGKASEPLRQWLLELDESNTLFVDLGPRVSEIDPMFLADLLLKKPLLTLNQDEIGLLLGQRSLTLEDVRQFALTHSLEMIYRADKEGAWLITHDRAPIKVPAYTVEVVDTIGAGDSHCGGVIASLSCGLCLLDSVAIGNAVAALSVASQGAANPPSVDALQAFLTAR